MPTVDMAVAPSQTRPVRHRVCVVGLGLQGLSQIEQLVRSDFGWEVAAVVDRATSAYARFQARFHAYGVPFFRTVAQALKARKVDAIVISTTAPSHIAIAEEAIEAGFMGALMIEKPISNSLPRANEFARLIAKKGWPGQVGVGFYRRCSDIYAPVRAAIEEGWLGELRRIEFSRPGKLSMRGSHYIDLANWFARSEPVQVCCQLEAISHPDHRGASFYDPAGHVSLTYPSGAVFVMDTTSASPRYQPGMTCFFDNGEIFIDADEASLHIKSNIKDRVYHSPEPDWHTRHYTWFDNALQALVAKTNYRPCTLAEAITCLEIVVAAFLSDRRNGEAVHLPLQADETKELLRVA